MGLGAVFPQNEIGDDPIAIRDYALAIEAVGVRHLLAYDHVLGADIANRSDWLKQYYNHQSMFHEPLMLFSYLAGIMRRLWTEESFSFAGRFDRLTEAGIRPLPRQRPIPVWIGGTSQAAMARAAQKGDGWLPVLSADCAEEAVSRFHEQVVACGRDPIGSVSKRLPSPAVRRTAARVNRARLRRIAARGCRQVPIMSRSTR